MKKIFKILGKSIVPILIVIVLLFIQVQLDLKLPEYTSNIVNVGIQQNGIEDSVPNVMSKKTYDLIIKFSGNDKEKIEKNYKLVTNKDKDYENYRKKFYDDNKDSLIDITSEGFNDMYFDIYVLKDISKEERKKLDKNISTPLIISYFLTSDMDEIVKIREQMLKDMDPNIDIVSMIDYMPLDQIEGMKTMFNEKMGEFEDVLLDQMKIQVVNVEYKTVGYDVSKIQTTYMLKTGGIMIAIAFGTMFITVIYTFLSARIGARFSRDLTGEVTKKVMSFSNKEFEEIGTASLITRSTNDIQRVQMLIVMGLRFILYAPILGIGAFMKVNTSPLAWVIGVTILTIFVLVVTLLVIALPKFNSLQKLVDQLNLVSREILTGLPVIRAFATEKEEEERFDKANQSLIKTNLFVNRVMAIMMPTMMLIMQGMSVLIIWVGAEYIDLGTLQVGTLMAFITYSMQIVMAFLMLTMISVMLPRGIVSLKRIAEILKKENSVKENLSLKKFDNNNGEIEFKEVYFRYPDADEDVLKDISFKVNKGSTTAFIGSTGSGKSTVINLLPRFYDVTSGKIILDGTDIKDVSLEDLRKKLGFVPQKGILFTGTVESNITFGLDDLNEKQMKKAAEIAQASDFIDKLDDKYEYEIAQGGTNVSGGQKQRLAIARAIAKDPEILIFDDSFSALDFKTDANLRKALKENLKNKTVLIVASRIATIMDADQIIVLDEGKIVGIGKHKELLQTNEVYKEIATSQLSEEELSK